MTKLPPNVQSMSRLAAGFGIVQSITWLVLGSLALGSYLNCGFPREVEDPPATAYFSKTLQQYFFLNEYCPEYRYLSGIVSAYDLHVWAATAIATSGVWLIISLCILFVVTDENIARVNSALYSWSIITMIVTTTDLALGAVFGMTFGTVGDLMNNYAESSDPSLFELSSVRTAAAALMVVALRGFVLMILNFSFIVLLLYYAYLINGALNRNEHTIHSMGPLYAYQGSKNQTEPWSTMGVEYGNHNGGEMNRAYSRSEHERERDNWNPSPSRRQQDVRDDSSYGRSLTRSDSWHRGRAPNQPPRPFSYLEEPQMFKAQPPRSPAPVPAPNAIPPWKRRDMHPLDPSQPIVPSPDYSPPQNRQPRLKSALKPSAY